MPFSAASTTARSALFESTRYARGHKALYTFEVNGEKASMTWDLHDLHRLQYFDHGDEGCLRGWRSIHVTDGDHPLHEALVGAGVADRIRAHVRPPGCRFPGGCGLGQARRARRSARRSETQAVCDAVLDSAEQKKVGDGHAGVTTCGGQMIVTWKWRQSSAI